MRMLKKKSIGIDELLGYALGVVGLSFGDFCLLTFGEFEAVMRSHREKEESLQQAEWERMRIHAVMTMQPHCKRRLNPTKVLPFAWDKRKGLTSSAQIPDKDRAKAAFIKRLQMREEG